MHNPTRYLCLIFLDMYVYTGIKYQKHDMAGDIDR